MKLKCYFAHPYNSIGSAEEKQIISILKERGVNVLNPFDDEDDIIKKHGKESYYPNPPRQLGRNIWIKDLTQIRKCNMMLVYLPTASMGSAAELMYALIIQAKRKQIEQPYLIQIISPLNHPLIAYAIQNGNQLFESVEAFDKMRKSDW